MLAFSLIPPELVQKIGYLVLFVTVTPIFPFLYLVLRMRAEAAGGREPGTGTYGGLLYFRTAGLLLCVAGAANLSYGWVSTTPVEPAMTRLSWGLFLGSGLFMLLNTFLGRFVHVPRSGREARRVFGGFVMILAGLVAFFAVVMLFITWFEEPGEPVAGVSPTPAELRADEIKLWGAWTLYFLALYLAAVLLLSRSAARENPGAVP